MKRRISITLDYDVANQIEVWAEESERSFSQYVNLLLRLVLKQLDQNPIPLS